jgi:hypothetical protein
VRQPSKKSKGRFGKVYLGYRGNMQQNHAVRRMRQYLQMCTEFSEKQLRSDSRRTGAHERTEKKNGQRGLSEKA